MEAADPRFQVEAPVRGALNGVMVHGIGLVGIVAALAFVPGAVHAAADLRYGAIAAAVVVLVGFAAAVRILAARHGRPDPALRDVAWSKAQELDAEDAMLGLLVAGWVPVALALALGVALWPHLTDPDGALAAAWVVLGVPPVVVAWIAAVDAWGDLCRDSLARAEVESAIRFRRYWAELGRGA